MVCVDSLAAAAAAAAAAAGVVAFSAAACKRSKRGGAPAYRHHPLAAGGPCQGAVIVYSCWIHCNSEDMTHFLAKVQLGSDKVNQIHLRSFL